MKTVELGHKGEALARRFLRDKGYRIETSNWRFKRAEIDIIARAPDDTLVFVEVKTRSTNAFGEPEVAVDDRKKALLAAAAAAYMDAHNHQWAFRFDIISIVWRAKGQFHLRHYEDVFFPGMF